MSGATHTVVHHVADTWGRLNALAWHYSDIAEESLDQFLQAEEKITPVPPDEDPTAQMTIKKELLSASFRTIVFSGMACESAIFDLAAIHLGDDYAKDYLDKLDLVSKWMLVPALICGSSLEKAGPAINSLIALTKTRNSLVHHKSMPAFPAEEWIPRAEKQLDKIVGNTTTAFKAVVLLSLELNKLIKTPAGVLPFFGSEARQLSSGARSARVQKQIERCVEIHARKSP
jgi:hypothetical protein